MHIAASLGSYPEGGSETILATPLGLLCSAGSPWAPQLHDAVVLREGVLSPSYFQRMISSKISLIWSEASVYNGNQGKKRFLGENIA